MGIVRNVVAFGAFVDVGLKHDGLIHVSEIADTYVKNPLDYLQVGQKVSVRITRIDPESGKIQLSRRGL
jgi:protein Tex